MPLPTTPTTSRLPDPLAAVRQRQTRRKLRLPAAAHVAQQSLKIKTILRPVRPVALQQTTPTSPHAVVAHPAPSRKMQKSSPAVVGPRGRRLTMPTNPRPVAVGLREPQQMTLTNHHAVGVRLVPSPRMTTSRHHAALQDAGAAIKRTLKMTKRTIFRSD